MKDLGMRTLEDKSRHLHLDLVESRDYVVRILQFLADVKHPLLDYTIASQITGDGEALIKGKRINWNYFKKVFNILEECGYISHHTGDGLIRKTMQITAKGVEYLKEQYDWMNQKPTIEAALTNGPQIIRAKQEIGLTNYERALKRTRFTKNDIDRLLDLLTQAKKGRDEKQEQEIKQLLRQITLRINSQS